MSVPYNDVHLSTDLQQIIKSHENNKDMTLGLKMNAALPAKPRRDRSERREKRYMVS